MSITIQHDRRIICESCRWWNPSNNDWMQAGHNLYPGFGCCELTRRDIGEDVYPDSLAIATDRDGGWNAVLVTQAEFSCSQWAQQLEAQKEHEHGNG